MTADTQAQGDLRSALERVTNNFRLLLAGKPVRDVEETLAEADAALQGRGTQEGEPSDAVRMAFLAEHWLSTVPDGMRLHQWLGEIGTLMKHGSLRGAIDSALAQADPYATRPSRVSVEIREASHD